MNVVPILAGAVAVAWVTAFALLVLGAIHRLSEDVKALRREIGVATLTAPEADPVRRTHLRTPDRTLKRFDRSVS